MTGPGKARLALITVFAVHAGVSGSFGPQVPAIKAQVGIDDGALGLALTAMAVGMFAGTRIAGWATVRAVPRTVIGPAVPLLCGALAVVGRVTSLGLLMAAMVAMGLAMGVLDVAMNAEAVDVESRWGRPLLGMLHGSWSSGLLLAGGLAALANVWGWSVSTHFTLVALLMVGAGLTATAVLPVGPRPDVSAVRPGRDPAAPLRYGTVAVLGLVAGASFAAEGAAIDWSAVYLHDTVATTAAVAAAGFVAFAGGMALSRFVTDRVVTRYGPVPVVRCGGLAGAAAMGLVLAVPVPLVVIAGLALLGMALAPVVPVVFRAAGAGPGGHRQLGWVVTTAYLGSVIGPATIGLAARLAGLRSALLVIVALALVIAALADRAAVTDR